MALILVTGPDQEPLTLEQAKAQLRLDVDADDELLRDMIKAAREWVEGQTKRALVTQTWDYKIDDYWPFKFGTNRITLPINPLASVTSITYQDSGGSSPQPILAASQYAIAARRHGSFIVPAYDVTWPSVRCVPDAITVRFIAGSAVAAVPKVLQRAVALLVAHMYENREAAAAKPLVAVPYGIESLIAPYRSGGLVR
jgi:uncharacterized phiE125 gp8 family phage protein